jgi:hypothetical protein
MARANKFVNFDDELWSEVQERRSEVHFHTRPKDQDAQRITPKEVIMELRYSIYPLLVRRIVEDVIRGRQG